MRAPNSVDIVRQRGQAKIGMSLSLGALVATGLLSRMDGPWNPGARTMHLCAGVALVGFSYWHLTLYQNHARIKGRTA